MLATREDDSGGCLTLRLAHSCYRHLIWDCGLVNEEQAARLLSGLSRRYADESRFAWVRELTHPDGHSIVVVPRTGRVQIRLHYLTPHGERERCARQVVGELSAALRCCEPV